MASILAGDFHRIEFCFQKPAHRNVSGFVFGGRMIANALKPQTTRLRKLSLSLDAWAVLIALGLAALVRAGALKHIPW